MKKSLFVALALLGIVACNKVETANDNNDPVQEPVKVSLSASLEEASLTTKAGVDGSYNITWSTGDAIGVRIYEGTTSSRSNEWDCKWTIRPEDNGKSNGVFDPEYAMTAEQNWAYAAYYPKNGTSHNVGGDGKVFYLYNESIDYVPGAFISPLVADMSKGDERPTTIAFKHVGGTIKITLNNVPAEANKITLTVDNNNITGWGSIDPKNAGTSGILASSLTDGDGHYATHSMTLNFEAGSETRNGLVFYFPVPVLTKPNITIDLYSYQTLIWSKSAAKAQTNDVGRGDILVMPALTVDARFLYVLDETKGWGAARNLYVHDGSDPYGPTFPGVYSMQSVTISEKEYVRFVLPYASFGESCKFVFSNGNSGTQVNLSDATVSSTPLYYRTDGILVATIADTSSPTALYTGTDKRIWAYKKNAADAGTLYCYAYGDSEAFGSWQNEGAKMTKYTTTGAQMESGSWYFISIPFEKQSETNTLIFSFGGLGDSNQTVNMASISMGSNHYFGINDNGESNKYCWELN